VAANGNAFAGDAEAFFPKDFDAKGKYTAYTYNGLYSHVRRTYGVSNAYLGGKVKVFAKPALTVRGNINPRYNELLKNRDNELLLRIFVGPAPKVSCIVCTRTAMITDADNVMFVGAAGTLWDKAMSSFNVYLAFPSEESFTQYHQALVAKCGAKDKRQFPISPGCHVAIAGTLSHEVAEFHESLRPFGPGKGTSDIPLLLVERADFFRDDHWEEKSNEASAKFVLESGKVLWKAYSMLAK
jgi:hypothetical protein